MDLLGRLRNGALAGAAAGLLTGGFGYLLAEPALDRAVRLETAREAQDHTGPQLSVEHSAEVFSRGTQHLGLLVAAVLTGLALGVLFAVVSAVRHRRAEPEEAWRASLQLAASGFFAVSLVPFVRFPPNPPGVGDPGTVDARTRAWLAAITVGLLGAVAAGRLAADLRARHVSEPGRQLAVAGVLLATLGLPFLLPGDAGPLEVPADLLWQFRLLALASSLLLWAGLGVGFGLLARAGRRPDGPGEPHPDPAVPARRP